MRGVEHDHLAGQAGARTGHLGLLPQRPRVAAADSAGEGLHRAQGRGPAGPVDGDAEAALQLAQRPVGLRPEDAVHRTREEPQHDQPLLQRRDVVAAHHVPGHEEEHAVAQAPAGGLEHAQGLGADDAVGEQAAPLLEGPDGRLEGPVVDLGCERVEAPGTRHDVVDELPQRDHAVAAVARPERLDGLGGHPQPSQAENSRSSMGLGRAPTTVLTSSPPEYTASVGRAVTP